MPAKSKSTKRRRTAGELATATDALRRLQVADPVGFYSICRLIEAVDAPRAAAARRGK